MSSLKFEIAAKNAIIAEIRKIYNETFEPKDVSVVWMAHLLGNKKGIFVDNGKNQRLYEATYNSERNEMYLDMYEKRQNTVIPGEELDTRMSVDLEGS